MTKPRPAVAGLILCRQAAYCATLMWVLAFDTIAPTMAAAQTPPISRADRVQWLQQHAAPIRSTDPADEDFSDLAPLGVAIAKARVVMLGEQSHGDGTTFLAKTRIIKYLHEKLGFDVLAFESGFYDMRKAWSFLKGGEDAATAVRRGVFGVWTRSAQLEALVEYLGTQVKSARPMELAGFDNQFTASASGEFFAADLRAFLAGHGVDTTSIRGWSHVTQLLDGLTSGSWFTKKPTHEQFAEYMSSWTDLRAHVDRIAAPDTAVAYWKQLLKSTGAYAMQFGNEADSVKESPEAHRSTRDAQMGENLLWLVRRKYPDRKIIVWAATFHIMRNPELINTGTSNPMDYKDVTPMGYKNVITMGHVVSNTLHDEVYAIGFIASEGRVGLATSPQHQPIPNPPRESLEGMLASTTLDNAFIDFRGLSRDGRWLQQPIISAPLSYSAYTANWTRVLDAMVYTRRMTPSTVPRPAYTTEERTAAACTDLAKLGCGLGLEQFALIPAGTFRMGSTTGRPHEQPVHPVTISHAFYLQKTEVTQAQWRDVMDTNPSFASSCGDTCPVEQVSWQDIQTFLQRLNAKTAGVTYRLPTEAEWEYAERAGTNSELYGPLDSIAWYYSNSNRKPHPAAGKQANAWGLFDMLGNVSEMVSDWFAGNYYALSTPIDPEGPTTGASRVLRGGSWGTGVNVLRAAVRNEAGAGVTSGSIGFRLVRLQ